MTDSPDSYDEIRDHGRVGYGQVARVTPVLLGLVIVAAIIFIAIDSRGSEKTIGRDLIGKPAPDLAMTRFDGTDVTTLSSLSNQVVVLNFWASWCEPCTREMPAFERVHQDGGSDLTIIGVDIKNDRLEAARALLAETAVTYPIMRDDGGCHPASGPIEQALGIGGSYPVTVFIRPDGVIDAIKIGELSERDIRDAVVEART
jgi:thiol-disulfide isomerase/thioredoxin